MIMFLMALGHLKHLLEKFLWDHDQNCREKSLKLVGNFFFRFILRSALGPL